LRNWQFGAADWLRALHKPGRVHASRQRELWVTRRARWTFAHHGRSFFDFSISKDFPWPFASAEGKRRINFRVDLINAFNHPNFRYFNTGNTPNGLGTFPTEITTEAVGGRESADHRGRIQHVGHFQWATAVDNFGRGDAARSNSGQR
jgi:hypothetical protein